MLIKLSAQVSVKRRKVKVFDTYSYTCRFKQDVIGRRSRGYGRLVGAERFVIREKIA